MNTTNNGTETEGEMNWAILRLRFDQTETERFLKQMKTRENNLRSELNELSENMLNMKERRLQIREALRKLDSSEQAIEEA